MLKRNVWTPSLTGKHPVLIYFHGGGFTFGSAYELPAQEGAQLARHHDAVSVTVNHRLNLLGFLDMSGIGGPAYADSVNVGMTESGGGTVPSRIRAVGRRRQHSRYGSVKGVIPRIDEGTRVGA